MKELKSIFWLLVLVVGGIVLYKVLPAYWGDYKLSKMMDEQAVVYTYAMKSDQEIAKGISEKAQELNVPLAPEQIKVDHTAAELSITAVYSVHVEIPAFPMDLNFTTKTHNRNVMK
jgi:hypothetical protein